MDVFGIKRYMKLLNGYVHTHCRPKGCIVESYIVEEVIEFCTKYMVECEAIRFPKKTLAIFIETEG